MDAETIGVSESTKRVIRTRDRPPVGSESARRAGERQSQCNPEEHRNPMPLRKIAVALAATAFVAVTPPRAAAQTVPSAYRFVDTRQEVGVFAGSASAAKGRFGFGPSGGPIVGARWGIDLTGPLGFEAVASVIRGTRDIINPAVVVGDRKIGEGDATIGTVDARLRLTLTGDRTWHRVAPFFIAGGGIAMDLGSSATLDEQLESDHRFEFGRSFFGTLGSGVRYFLTDRLALRGDAVFSLWKIDTPPGFSDPDLGFTAVEESEWASAFHLAVAVVIRY